MTNAFPLTAIRLRFHCQAESPLRLGGWQAGSNLRGALLNVMTRATCAAYPLTPGPSPTGRGVKISGEELAVHTATCPVCWLVQANERPGQERRGYTLIPPLNTPEVLEAGIPFTFWLTLFGEAREFLPYFALAVPEAGRCGVGYGWPRGRFSLRQVWAEKLVGDDWQMLAEGDNLFYPPANPVGHEEVLAMARRLSEQLEGHRARVKVTFLTPLRLIEDKKLVKSPDFGVFFARLLKQVDDLAVQFGGGYARPAAELDSLWAAANRVRLVESKTRWVEVASGSARSGQKTWLSGLVGPVVYSAALEDWDTLFPWLVWGQLTQVGRGAPKGNGVFVVEVG
ncbi:MAG: CRISPR system precrRNA processing endoribonuclease RAMP protein Cas6 [Anaerolineales bacterium]|nr:CRISPR system precrRNA processing endoribonuclease RAMP protein Cas6 [Anaerolineales bacterium]